MDYRTILVHCNDKRRIESLLAPAVALAETFGSHLVALSVVPPVVVVSTGAPLGPPVVIDAHCELYRSEDNPTMKAAFDAATRGRGLVAEWREDDAGPFGVADCVLPQAFTADLVVAGQTDPQWPGSARLDIADRLAMESGRPVLIVPNAGVPERIGERVLVAWDAGREAARAAYDALPILQRAREVRVVRVNPQSEREPAQDLPASDICAALARHGVRCGAAPEQIAPSTGVGETLLACAQDWKADLLVMGCYGHTRLRELILGGASRHVLSRMTIPVLMSH
jgi:nucleotide-binding universal stress UspA family protein